jgi:hypothetical protein
VGARSCGATDVGRRHHTEDRGAQRDAHAACGVTAVRIEASPMRTFHFDRCWRSVPFSTHRCHPCDAEIGDVTEQRSLRVLHPTTDPAGFATEDRDLPRWRSLSSPWGCNSMLAAASNAWWCRSCSPTRGRPDEAHPDAVDAWSTAEAAQRRLVHQLDELALPIEIWTSSTSSIDASPPMPNETGSPPTSDADPHSFDARRRSPSPAARPSHRPSQTTRAAR